MKFLQTITVAVLVCACAQTVAFTDAKSALDEGVAAGNIALIKAALTDLETAHQQVPLLPLLQKLQVVEAHKRHAAKCVAWPLGVVSLCGLTVMERLFGAELPVSDSVYAGLVFICGPLPVYALYKRWARRMHERTIMTIARLLLAKKNVCVAGNDAPLVEYELVKLGELANKPQAKA